MSDEETTKEEIYEEPEVMETVYETIDNMAKPPTKK